MRASDVKKPETSEKPWLVRPWLSLEDFRHSLRQRIEFLDRLFKTAIRSNLCQVWIAAQCLEVFKLQIQQRFETCHGAVHFSKLPIAADDVVQRRLFFTLTRSAEFRRLSGVTKSALA